MTVPQVQFITQPASGSGAQPSIGLAAGAPSSVAVGTSQTAGGSADGVTTLKSSFGVATGTGGARSTSTGLAVFQGGAVKGTWSGVGAGVGAIFAILGML